MLLYLTRLVTLLFVLAALPLAQAQRDLTDIPLPNPTAERAAMHVAEGFEVNLFASDPDFSKPIHMGWDSQGRLWIASSNNYPQLKPGAEPTDQVIVLEDTDGDGVADRRSVFADDLMIPTAVLPGDGGVYVANSTQLIHLRDTNGDGRADARRTVLSGFGTEDTHHLLHTLRWRPDGRMAMNQSIYIHSHLETPYGVKHLDGGGIWHFDPNTSRLDIFCKGLVNPWGHAIDPFGQSLATDGAGTEGINYPFPGAVFVTSPGATRWLRGLNPGSPKHCGLEFISGDAMPSDMQGILVTNDFRGHRVCRFQVERHGSGYRSIQLPDLIRSEHIAFRPIDVKMGPDGALYIADWYNPIIQHGEVDFRDPRRDTQHGRIWRVSAKGKGNLPRQDYEHASERELVDMLADSAMWVRHFARQELTKRDPTDVDKALDEMDASAAEHLPLQRLWLQQATYRLDVDLLDELRQHADPRIRAASMRVVGEQHSQLDHAETWLSEATQDSDDQVVLEAVCGLHRLGNLSAVRSVLNAAGRESKDQNLEFAIWNCLRDTESLWLPAFESGDLSVDNGDALEALADAATQPTVARSMVDQLDHQVPEQHARTVALIGTRGDAESVARLVKWIAGSQKPEAEKAALLETVVAQCRSRRLTPSNVSTWFPQLLQDVSASKPEASPLLTTFANAAAAWRVVEFSPTLNAWLDQGIADKNQAVVGATTSALAALGIQADRARVRRLAADSDLDIRLRARAIAALSVYDASSAARMVVEMYQLNLPEFDSGNLPREVVDSVATLLSRKPGADAIAKAVSSSQADRWTPNRAREFLAAVRGSSQASDELIATIVSATGLENAGWKMSAELTSRLAELSKEGDAARGEEVYRRESLQCIRCHAIGPSGVAVGPNLVSLGGSATPDYIIESLIDPAAKAKEGFQTMNVLLDDDQIISGLQKAKTAEALQLLLADGTTRTIPNDSIEAVRDGKSLMPAGLLDQLTQRELADLIAFLSKLGRAPEYTVDTRNWVRNWHALQWSDAAHRRLNRTSLATAATDDPALTWKLLASRVDGSVPLAEASPFQPHRDVPPTVFLRFDLQVLESGSVRLRLTQPLDAVQIWIDGESRPTPSEDEPIEFPEGTHRIVFGIRIGETDGTFACEVLAADTDAAAFQVP